MRGRLSGRRSCVTLGAVVVAMLAWACWSPYSEDDEALTPRSGPPGEGRNDAGTLEGEEAAAPSEGGTGWTDSGSGDAGSTADRYRAAVLGDGPRAYWRLDETSGLVAADQSGNKLDAAYQGTCTKGVPGPFPNTTAIELAGACEIQAPVIDFSQRDAFTLEIWAKPRVLVSSHRRLFGHGVNNAQGYQHFGLYFREPAGIVFERSIDNQIANANAAAPPLGRFVHVAGVYDGSTLTLYVDGLPLAQAADARSQVQKNAPFWIGTNGSENFFDGVLAEAAVYSKALSADTIAKHHAIGTQAN